MVGPQMARNNLNAYMRNMSRIWHGQMMGSPHRRGGKEPGERHRPKGIVSRLRHKLQVMKESRRMERLMTDLDRIHSDKVQMEYVPAPKIEKEVLQAGSMFDITERHPWRVAVREMNHDTHRRECMKRISTTSRRILSGRRASRLSEDEIRGIMELVDSEKAEERAAAAFIAASRKGTGHGMRVLGLVHDEDGLVWPVAFFALSRIADEETVKGMLRLIADGERGHFYELPVQFALSRLKNSGTDKLGLVLDAMESMIQEQWFLAEKESGSYAYSRIMETIDFVLMGVPADMRIGGSWWLKLFSCDRDDPDPPLLKTASGYGITRWSEMFSTPFQGRGSRPDPVLASRGRIHPASYDISPSSAYYEGKQWDPILDSGGAPSFHTFSQFWQSAPRPFLVRALGMLRDAYTAIRRFLRRGNSEGEDRGEPLAADGAPNGIQGLDMFKWRRARFQRRLVERFRRDASDQSITYIEEKVGKAILEMPDAEVARMIENPFSILPDGMRDDVAARMIRKARRRFLRSLGRKRRKAIERLSNMRLKDVPAEYILSVTRMALDHEGRKKVRLHTKSGQSMPGRIIYCRECGSANLRGIERCRSCDKDFSKQY